METPGIIDSRFSGIRELCFQCLPSIMSVTSATSGALADGEQGDARGGKQRNGHTAAIAASTVIIFFFITSNLHNRTG